jgi:hypothetical protein
MFSVQTHKSLKPMAALACVLGDLVEQSCRSAKHAPVSDRQTSVIPPHFCCFSDNFPFVFEIPEDTARQS